MDNTLEIASRSKQAVGSALSWIENVMFPQPMGTGGVWERIRIDKNANTCWVRSDATAEAAKAFFLRWEKEGNERDREVAHNLLRFLSSLQYPFGPFPFYRYVPEREGMCAEGAAGGATIWPNDNGKVLGLVCEMAPHFPSLALRAAGTRLGDYFVKTQKSEGWWHLDGTDYPGTCFVCWPLAGLSRLYALTGEARYKESAAKALEYLRSLQLPDGRMRTSYEINGVENWRPASSETAKAVLAFAVAQRSLSIDLGKEMNRCFEFLSGLIDESGAIRNCDDSCLKASEQNDPDLTDLVYTDGYALLGFQEAYAATKDKRYRAAAETLASFLTGIQCQGESELWDGGWRGSYDVAKSQWRGRADQKNPFDEGGMYSVYTGWSTLPIIIGLQSYCPQSGERASSDLP